MGLFKKVFLECLGKTSIKGVPRIAQRGDVSLRVLWLFGVLVLGGMATFTLANLMGQYLEFATTTTVSQRTIYGKDHALDMMLVVCSRPPISGTGLRNSGDIITFQQYREMVDKTLPKSEDTKGLFDDLSSYPGYYQYIGKANATRLGHQLDTFIVDCTMLYISTPTTKRQKKCQMEKIQQISNPWLFNCYKMPVLDMDFRAGIPIGLSLLLYMDSPQREKCLVTDDTEQSSGLVMYLGSPNTMIDVFSTSFDVRPGEATTARVRVEERITTSEPYSTCTGVNDVFYKDFDGHNVSYTAGACVNACIQDKVASTCNCTDPELVVVRSDALLNLTFCKSYSGNTEQIISASKCLDNVITTESDMFACGLEGRCTRPCNEYNFPVFPTTSVWPERSQLMTLYKTIISHGKQKYGKDPMDYETLTRMLQSENDASDAEELLTDFIQDNFAKVTVVVSSPNAIVFREVPTMTFNTLLSQLGGALNLYSGVSLIVCVEMLELVYKLFAYFAADANKSNRVSDFST